MSEKRKYNLNKDYKSITVRFNFTEKKEKALFVFLNSMSPEDRTTFILEMYEKRAEKNNNLRDQSGKMTVYEEKLFEIVGKAIENPVSHTVLKTPAMGMTESNLPSILIPDSTKREKTKLQSNKVNYDNIDLKKEKKEKIDLESIIDDFTESGMR